MPIAFPWAILVRMTIFVALISTFVFLYHEFLLGALRANLVINVMIGGVLVIAVLFCFRSLFLLLREIAWLNGRLQGRAVARQPILLEPVAVFFAGQGARRLSPGMLRVLLDAVSLRLDETRVTARYLGSLLVFMGLLGTFWGLLQTVSSVGDVIRLMKPSGDPAALINDVKTGLAGPLAGMGMSFSSSLFGIAGSMIVGFLNLQSGYGHYRFYNRLESWLGSQVDSTPSSLQSAGIDFDYLFDRLSRIVRDMNSNSASETALASVADSLLAIAGAVKYEQNVVQDWAAGNAKRDEALKRLAASLTERVG